MCHKGKNVCPSLVAEACCATKTGQVSRSVLAAHAPAPDVPEIKLSSFKDKIAHTTLASPENHFTDLSKLANTIYLQMDSKIYKRFG